MLQKLKDLFPSNWLDIFVDPFQAYPTGSVPPTFDSQAVLAEYLLHQLEFSQHILGSDSLIYKMGQQL